MRSVFTQIHSIRRKAALSHRDPVFTGKPLTLWLWIAGTEYEKAIRTYDKKVDTGLGLLEDFPKRLSFFSLKHSLVSYFCLYLSF